MPLKIPPQILPPLIHPPHYHHHHHHHHVTLSSAFFLQTSALLPSALLLRRPYASSSTPPQKKTSGSSSKSGSRSKKNQRTHFRQYDLKDADRFSLVDAIRYIRAFEVGQNPQVAKYELAVKLHAQKNGPMVKNRIRLPKAVKTDMRICVIAEGKFAEEAKKAGAILVGTTEVFEQIKAGQIDFDQCLCHEPSYSLLTKSQVGRILGPKGLMPSPKTGTVVQNPASAVADMTGSSEYRERLGVIRMAVGQLGFTEKELQKNIVAFMQSIKKDITALSGKTEKGIVEVVLSSTNGPGMSLTGEIRASAPEKTSAATTGMMTGAGVNVGSGAGAGVGVVPLPPQFPGREGMRVTA